VFIALTPAVAAAPVEPTNVPDSQQIIGYLDRTVSWYRHLPVEQQLASEPADLSFLEDNRRLASQIVRLSFDFARADVELLADSKDAAGASGQQGAAASPYSSLLDLADKAEKQVKNLQAELDSLRPKFDSATGKRRESLQSTIAETQSELDLAVTRRDVMRNMLEFVGGANATGSGASGVRAQIEELEKTLPAVGAKDAEPGNAAGADRSRSLSLSELSVRPEPGGLLSLTTDLFALSRKASALNESIRITADFAEAAQSLRTPLSANLKAIAQRGDALGNEPDSTDPAVLTQQKSQIDALTLQFKQQAAAVLPLAKQRILLDLYGRSLASWHTAVKTQYTSELKSLLLRLALLGVVLALVFGGAELWRKAIFRYVQESQRRHQLLLFRRIACWFLTAVILVFAFATELSSLATFAGLMTAGIALALQSVILSVVGYFFLIGKYGVRVGDRVQIAGVSGEVVEIGLVRLHVMEMGSGAVDAQPTGRVVAFSNAAVFQAAGGIFRQIPGTSFVWHEITLLLEPEADVQMVEERLMGAVTTALLEYQDEMEGQRQRMEKAINSVTVRSLAPSSRLRLTQTGIEIVIRYPLELEKAAAVDGRIAHELLDAIECEPKLKLVGSTNLNIASVAEAVQG